MLESPNASLKFDLNHQPASTIPAIDENGRIRLPGFPAGLSIQSYLPLVHQYAKILEASRILDRYRDNLRLMARFNNALSKNGEPQAPLTALTPSTLLSHLYYKREDQTATRAYKLRGAVVGMAKLMESSSVKRFLTASTGNHALGVLKAAELLLPQSVRLVVPGNTASVKLEKLRKAIDGLNANGVQADLLFRGHTFDEARNWALCNQSDDEAYLDPYSDPWVIAGQGTLGLELLQQTGDLLRQTDYEEVVIVSPIGGGGLLTGTATALKLASAWEPAFRNVNVRFLGLRLSDLNAPLGEAIRVAEIAPVNQVALQSLNVAIKTMTQAQMEQGVEFVRHDLGHVVEGASGGTLHPVLSDDAYKPTSHRLVISVLSGGNA
jgi:threonine dehydratase